VRSAATTFWFMSDPNMDKALYKSTFGLSDGQCEAIRNLTPKKEAFLWQPEIGVSKVVLFDVEVEQAIMNASHPRDASMRDKLIQLHGFERGMELAVEHFKRQGFGDVDDSRVRAIA
jgi:type IV secretion system protein VirB4